MNIEAFDQLSENQKLEVLLDSGSVISERKDKANRSFLYYLGSFYVVVKFQTGTDDLAGIEALDIGRKEHEDWQVLGVLPYLPGDGERANDIASKPL
jgi:hypothetical protein